MHIVSFIEDHIVLDKIIEHLKLTFKAEQSPLPFPRGHFSIAVDGDTFALLPQEKDLLLNGLAIFVYDGGYFFLLVRNFMIEMIRNECPVTKQIQRDRLASMGEKCRLK